MNKYCRETRDTKLKGQDLQVEEQQYRWDKGEQKEQHTVYSYYS